MHLAEMLGTDQVDNLLSVHLSDNGIRTDGVLCRKVLDLFGINIDSNKN